VNNQIAELKKSLKGIEFKDWYYKTAMELGSEKEVQKLIPENMATLEIDKIPKK